MNTTISVVIPTYNRGSNLKKTLDSVLAQTLEPLEIIVVDDGSTDGTPDWIETHYGAQIQVIRQPNGGVANARNRGLQEARGQYIAFLDHDDIWLPRKLEFQFEVAQAHPEVALIGCNWNDVNDDGTPLENTHWNMAYRDWRATHGWSYSWMCAMPCPIPSMTLPLLRTENLRAIGGFDPNCVPCDDWDMYLRLAHRFPFGWANETLALYVHHSNQQSGDVSALHRAMKKIVAKQWPRAFAHPRSLLFWWNFHFFLASFAAYARAKAKLAAERRVAAWYEIAGVALRYPCALFSKQWIYFTLRLIRGQTEPY